MPIHACQKGAYEQMFHIAPLFAAMCAGAVLVVLAGIAVGLFLFLSQRD
jgi:hypothetical protein